MLSLWSVQHREYLWLTIALPAGGIVFPTGIVSSSEVIRRRRLFARRLAVDLASQALQTPCFRRTIGSAHPLRLSLERFDRAPPFRRASPPGSAFASDSRIPVTMSSARNPIITDRATGVVRSGSREVTCSSARGTNREKNANVALVAPGIGVIFHARIGAARPMSRPQWVSPACAICFDFASRRPPQMVAIGRVVVAPTAVLQMCHYETFWKPSVDH